MREYTRAQEILFSTDKICMNTPKALLPLIIPAIFGICAWAESPDAGPGGAPARTETGWKLPAWLQLGGQIRGRFESPSGASMTNNSSDSYYLSRIRLDLGIRPTSWLRFFAKAQDARVAGYNTSPAPSTIYDPIDLRQAYAEVKHDGAVSVMARVGRQELAFGGERLIGPADWGMSRTFDAADVKIAYR